MNFSVTILGSASAKPTASRHPSAQAVNFREQYYLVDAGGGAAAARALRHQPLKLRAVFISHLHGDHVYGLFPLLSTLGLYGRRTPPPIYAPAPFGEMLEAHLRFFRLRPALRTRVARGAHHGTRPCCSKTARWRCGPCRCATVKYPPPDSSSARRRPPSMPTRRPSRATDSPSPRSRPREAGRGPRARHGRGAAQRRRILPAPCAPRLRLPLGHEPLGQGRGAVRRRRSDVPRGDLRRGRKPPRPRAGHSTTHDAAKAASRPVRDAC